MVSFPSIEVSNFVILGGNPVLNLASRVLEVSCSPTVIPKIEVFITSPEASTAARVRIASVSSLAALLFVSLLVELVNSSVEFVVLVISSVEFVVLV
jgi:hypothetical protein